jgi:hypothetical protein
MHRDDTRVLQLAGHLGFMEKPLSLVLGHFISIAESLDGDFAVQLAINRSFDDSPSTATDFPNTQVARRLFVGFDLCLILLGARPLFRIRS